MSPDPPDDHAAPTGDYDPKPDADSSAGDRVGERIGPFKLLQLLGEGGMGIVYVAEQSEPVRRRVALKIIKPGVATAHVLARFEQERQALALMDHPNIAKVLDAGESPPVAPGGLPSPYIVMELVKGVPITKFCDDAKLTPRQRLELFIPVCQAIQHAHQKGIIHRDLKPSNVLIAIYDGKPVPKVIDFGVAKATGPRLTEHTVFTDIGNIIGTLEYMAPEQAELNNLDIDTRADVYALGVLLYELLTGSVPFSRKELQAAGLGEMIRVIQQVEPTKPSTKISSSLSLPSIAAVRQMEPAKLTKLVRGELDWITMKALEKDRSRRYETANALAMEIQRYLNDEPVLAGPPSAAYRLRKAIHKHRGRFIAAAALFLTLVTGLFATTTQAYRATQAETRLGKSLEEKQIALDNESKERKRADDAARVAEEQNEKNREHLSYANLQLSQKYFQEKMFGLAKQTLARLFPEHRGWSHNYLESHFQGSYATLFGHGRTVHRVTYRPDGAQLATASEDGSIKLWDAITGREELSLSGHIDTVHWVTFNSGGTLLASASSDKSIKLWDPHSGRELRTLGGHSDSVTQVVFSPDGLSLASTGRDMSIKVWNSKTGQLQKTLENESPNPAFAGMPKSIIPLMTKNRTIPAPAIAFSPDGTRLVSGLRSSIKVWNLQSGQVVQTIPGLIGVSCIAFSPDGSWMATIHQGNFLTHWDARSWKRVSTSVVGINATCVAFSPDGLRLAVGTQASGIEIIEVSSRRTEMTLPATSTVTSVAFSADGARLASAGFDRAIQLWDVRSRHKQLHLSNYVGNVEFHAFDSKGLRLATVNAAKTIHLWDAQTGQLLAGPIEQTALTTKRNDTEIGQLLASLVVDTDRTTGIALSEDGNQLATIGKENANTLWDLRNGQKFKLSGHGMYVNCVAFSPDNERLATGGDDKTIKLWNARTGQLISTLQGHLGAVSSLAFSPNSKHLASGSWYDRIMIWDVQTGQVDLSFKPDSMVTKCVAFSPDSMRLATGGSDRTVKLWEVNTGREQFEMQGHSAEVAHLAFSPDGRRVVSREENGKLKVWNADTGREEVSLIGPIGNSQGNFAMSQSGMVLSAFGDGLIRYWEWRALTNELKLRGHTANVVLVAFSPGGSFLASASIDGTIRLWDTEKCCEVNQWQVSTKGIDKRSAGISFDRSGRHIKITMDDVVVFDTVSGKRVDNWKPADFVATPEPARSHDKKRLALPQGMDIRLVDLSGPSESDLEFRCAVSRPDPWWHAERFKRALLGKDVFAAAFHYRWLTVTLPIAPLPAAPFGLPLGLP